jgi:hypothetical protein
MSVWFTRWVGHVERMGPIRNVYTLLVGKLKGRKNLRDLGADWSIIIKWVSNKI